MDTFIENIEIKNFKSIRHLNIPGCKKINLFIGPPNAGKSNLLEALGLLTFIRQQRPIGLKGLIRFEKLTHIFHYFNIHEPLTINFNNNYSLLISYENEKRLGFTLKDVKEKDSLYSSLIYRSALEVGAETLHSSQTNKIDDFSGRIPSLKNLTVKPYRFSSEKKFNKSFSALELEVPLGENLSEVIVNNSELKKQFSELFRLFGFKLLINVADSEIAITPEIKNEIIYAIPFSLIADTLIRLIFFETAICSNKNSVLLFEEPEAHCYEPYIQEITNHIKYDSNNNQFFIVTHSQFVIDELLRDEESKRSTNIYLVGLENESTSVKLLNPEKNEDVFHRGLNVFFNFQNLWNEN